MPSNQTATHAHGNQCLVSFEIFCKMHDLMLALTALSNNSLEDLKHNSCVKFLKMQKKLLQETPQKYPQSIEA